jgi:hypothetical protein
MDWLTFLSTMTSALAWPVAVGALVIVFRGEIRSIVAGMKRLKLGPMEAEMFERQAREVRDLAVALPARSATIPRLPTPRTPISEHELQIIPPTVDALPQPDGYDIDTHLLELITSPTYRAMPRNGVLKVWTAIEDALRSLAERSDADPNATFSVLLLDLQRRKSISKDEFELLRKLSSMRDDAYMSTVQVTEDAALDYVAAASTILRKIGLSDKPGRSFDVRSVAQAVPIR